MKTAGGGGGRSFKSVLYKLGKQPAKRGYHCLCGIYICDEYFIVEVNLQ